ncbi:tyrosine-type recombinase/integrase [Vibrio cholerae]|nr:tyrosine-type recombinase/integrase [Vibrio cholerae]ELF1353661.1 tyrosine-type recombinase/integrase [Vibrio cholerae]HDZ9129620.1 tyrosine-type recombinase/integrase [Vibrio cholerae]
MGILHDKTVKKLIKEQSSVRHSDGDGLYLMTPKRGDAYWMLRYTTPATKLRREYTIGKVDDWSLADARDEAAKLRLAIKREGVDPVQERKKVNQNPFKTLNDLYADYHQLRQRQIATHEKEKSLYEREVAWRIGKVELDKIRPLDISEILRDIANGYGDKPPRPTISNDVMRMLKRIFDHGIKLDVTQFNPASPFRPKDAGGEEQAANDPMTETEVVEFFTKLRAIPAQFSRENYLACALLIATCTRKMELLAAPWHEFDLPNRVWHLPKNRTKKRRAIDIPLSDAALLWLEELKIRSCGSEWVFPARRISKKARTPHVCENTLNHALKKLFEQNFFSFEKRRVHDLRGTARTRMGKMNIPDNIAQRCLNQIPGNRTDGIYNKDAYFEERKVAHNMLGEWLAPIVNGDGENKIVNFDTVFKSQFSRQ